jgi:type IV pilus assembly protein PilQ
LKREAETDLLIMDGHTAVIGGIYTRNTGRNLDQVPFSSSAAARATPAASW